MGPIQSAFNTINDRLDFLLSGTYSNIANSVIPTVSGLVILLFAWQGYKLIYGRGIGESFSSSIVLMIKYVVILSMLSSYDVYRFWVVDIFINLPSAIPFAIVIGGDTVDYLSGSMASKLDEYLLRSSSYGWDLVSITSPGESILGIIIIISAVIVCVFCILQIGIAEIGTIIFLVLGPFALACGMFPQTRGVFEGWLRVLITFLIVKILIMVIVALLLGSFGNAAEAMASNTRSSDRLSFIVTFLIYTILMVVMIMRVPEFASQMGGGLALSASNMTATAVRSATTTMRSARQNSATAGAAAARGVIGARAGMQEAQATNRSTTRGALVGAAAGALRGPAASIEDTSNRARRMVGSLKSKPRPAGGITHSSPTWETNARWGAGSFNSPINISGSQETAAARAAKEVDKLKKGPPERKDR